MESRDLGGEFFSYLRHSRYFDKINQNISFLKYLNRNDLNGNNPNQNTNTTTNNCCSFLYSPAIRNIFPNDLRLWSVYEMLQYYEPVNMTKTIEITETELLQEQGKYALRMLLRTLSLPIAMAAFAYSSGESFLQEKISIPPLCLGVKLPPNYKSVIEPDLDEIDADAMIFPSFNNAVGYSLRLPKNKAYRINQSWINYNKPTELSGEYGGLIMGFSLIGNDDFLNFPFLNELLNKGNPMLSCGALISLGIKYKGTGDVNAASILSYYIPAFHPIADVESEGTLIVQMAAIIGAGLIYLNSSKKPIVEYLMKEIVREGIVYMNPKSLIFKNIFEKELYNDAYKYASAFALGLVCLGIGNNEIKTAPIKNVGILGELLRLSMSSFWSGPASLACALIWMDSGNLQLFEDASLFLFNHVLPNGSPQHVLFYGIFRNLICILPLDDLKVSLIDLRNKISSYSSIPHFQLINHVYHAISMCVCLAVRNASSCDAQIMCIFEEFLLMLEEFSQNLTQASSCIVFKRDLIIAAVSNCINTLFTCIGTLYGGSGDISILRMFRLRHDLYREYSYHYALHLAIGLLLLGCGRFSFDCTLLESKAFLLIFLLPFYPQSFNDNSCYFQPLRYLWVLCTRIRQPTDEFFKNSIDICNDMIYSYFDKFLSTPALEDALVKIKNEQIEEDKNSASRLMKLLLLKKELFNTFKCGAKPSNQLFEILDEILDHSA